MKGKHLWVFLSSVLAVVCLSAAACAGSLRGTPQAEAHPLRAEQTEKSVAARAKTIVEAEDAYLFSGCAAAEKSACSQGAIVQSASRAYAEYAVEAEGEEVVDLTVKLNYIGDQTSMAQVMEIAFNGEPLSLADKPLHRTSKDRTAYEEFPLGKVSLRQGQNTLRMTCKDESFFVDYFAFSVPTVYEGGMSVIEAENALAVSINHPAPLAGASGGSVLDHVSTGKFAFTVISSKAALASAALCFAYRGDGDRALANMMKIYVNGRQLTLGNVTVSPSPDGEVASFSLGTVYLRSGANTIAVESKSRSIQYDAIVLSEAELPVMEYGEPCVVEAEAGARCEGCGVQTQGGRMFVSDNAANSSVTYLVRADSDFSAQLHICIGYWGAYDRLGRVLYITVNGRLLNLDGVAVHASDSEENCKFELCDAGMVPLNAGINCIVITSVDAHYNLDHFILDSFIVEMQPSYGA